MHWSCTLETAPLAEPLATADYKSAMHVDHTDDDTLIAAYALTARQLTERVTNRSLINTVWKLRLDGLPCSEIRLPKSTLVSVGSIEYVDTTGTTVTLATTEYRVDKYSQPARITPEYGKSWPVIRQVTNSVIITFTAGYGTAGTDVPAPILQAMRLLVASWYKVRENVTDKKLEELPRPLVYSALIAPYTVEVAI